MQSYLQTQELWEVVNETEGMLHQLQPTTHMTDTGQAAVTIAVPVPDDEMAQYCTEYSVWNKTDNKALSALTLHLTPQLRHYHTIMLWTTWNTLQTAFGGSPMSAIYVDFKQVVNIKLSSGNSVPEIEQMAILFGQLHTNQLVIPPVLQELLLLAAMPAKWDPVTQLYMQCPDLHNTLTLEGVQTCDYTGV